MAHQDRSSAHSQPPTQKAPLSDRRVVGTSLLVSVSDVVLNITVAVFTGSAVMLAQALQGVSDVMTAGILYLGTKRSNRKADVKHPLGYGREIFFWALIAAFVMLLGTGMASFYFGYQHFRNPSPVDNIALAVAMLVFGLVTNGYAFSRSVVRLGQNDGPANWWRRAFASGMVETKITFVVDLMGSLAALFGLIAITTVLLTGDARFDGIGAMIVGISTMIAALLIMVDVHALIVGRTISAEMAKRIVRIASSHEHVHEVLDLYALYLGADKLLVILELHLDERLTTNEIEKTIDHIKRSLRTELPQIHRVQIEVETPDAELIA